MRASFFGERVSLRAEPFREPCDRFREERGFGSGFVGGGAWVQDMICKSGEGGAR